jgi:hypothetical protein
LPEQDLKFLSASGFLPGRMGKRGDCISVVGMKYWLLSLGPFPSSMCVPEICTESDVQAILKPLLNIISPKEPVVARVSTLEILTAQYKEGYKPGTGFWITLSFIVLFTVFSIVATLCNQISKQSQQKQKEKEKEKESLHFRANYESDDDLDLNGSSQIQSYQVSDTKPGQTTFQDSTIINSKQNKKIGELETPLVSNSAQSKAKSPTTLQEIIQAFDFVDRWNLLKVSKRPTVENAAFDLIKVISMAWVV